jgi:predicted nucleic acid-binding protein
LEDSPEIFPAWEKLAIEYAVAGKSAHDARLVATMQVHGENAILTYDSGFHRYEGITVVTPDSSSG